MVYEHEIRKYVLMLAVIVICVSLLSGCGGGGSGSGGEFQAAGDTPEKHREPHQEPPQQPSVSGYQNLTLSGQALRSGDWCQISGTGFGSSKDSGSGAVVFTDGTSSVPATLYSSWSDDTIVCRVPDGIPTISVTITVITISGSTSTGFIVSVSATPNPSPEATPPSSTPTPNPTSSPNPTPSPNPPLPPIRVAER